jgi:hypothetical protein
MDSQSKSKIDNLLKGSLEKFDTLDNALNDALDGLAAETIRPTALAQLLQVRLQYLQFFVDIKKDALSGDEPNNVLAVLQKAPPDLREEFLIVWEKILKHNEALEDAATQE